MTVSPTHAQMGGYQNVQMVPDQSLFLAQQGSVQDQTNLVSFGKINKAKSGEWYNLAEQNEFSPSPRYGHSANLYEPANSLILKNLKSKLQKTDQGIKDQSEFQEDDTAFMIVFGGKDTTTDQHFNDIFFLSIP